jgi:hypothetical protein
MSCEIIQFSAAARPSRAVSDKREGKPELPPPATETAKNARIRIERRDAWWLAERVADYWKARLDWHAEFGTAQKTGSATAPRSHRLRTEPGMGWSINGASRS